MDKQRCNAHEGVASCTVVDRVLVGEFQAACQRRNAVGGTVGKYMVEVQRQEFEGAKNGEFVRQETGWPQHMQRAAPRTALA